MDANFVTVNAEVATPAPWRSRSLRTEKLSRAAANLLLYAGLLVNVLAILFLLGQFFLTNTVKRDLAAVERSSQKASLDLMLNASNALQSDSIKHMVRIQKILDALQRVDGTLVKYEVVKGKVSWEALVPTSFSGCEGELKSCQVVGLEKDGRARIKGTQ